MVCIHLARPVTHDELRELSDRNPGYQFERTADGRLVVSPTGGLSGRRSGEVFRQLSAWNHQTASGVAFDSSTGISAPGGGCAFAGRFLGEEGAVGGPLPRGA
ncbi:MAG: Uma2 family endonuclease [Armatimonadetes bacterium]|nr:Uma2 family endonuclease [Armatimonadota bacterium]